MKFILLSVFLAHGAAVYTVCTPVSRWLYQPKKQDHVCEFAILTGGNKEASDQGDTSPNTARSSYLNTKRHTTKIINESSTKGCAPAQNGRFTQDGWQMIGNLSINTTYNISIRFTIDSRGYIENVTVLPFTPCIYQTVCDQLNQIHFVWHGTSPPPTYTKFEKKICLIR